MSNANHSYEFERFVAQQHEKLNEILKRSGEGEDYWKNRSKRVEEIATSLANYDWKKSFEDSRQHASQASQSQPSQSQPSAPVSQGAREELEEVVTIAMPAAILARRRTTPRPEPDALSGSLDASPAVSLCASNSARDKSDAATAATEPKQNASTTTATATTSANANASPSSAPSSLLTTSGLSPRTPRLPTPPPLPTATAPTATNATNANAPQSLPVLVPLPSPRKISRSHHGNAPSAIASSSSSSTLSATALPSNASTSLTTPLAESTHSSSSGGIAQPLAIPHVPVEPKKERTSPRDSKKDRTSPRDKTGQPANANAASNAPTPSGDSSPAPKDQAAVSSAGADSSSVTSNSASSHTSNNATSSATTASTQAAPTPSATALLTSKSKLAVKRRPSAEEKSAKISSLKVAMQSQSSNSVTITSPRSTTTTTTATATTAPFSPREETDESAPSRPDLIAPSPSPSPSPNVVVSNPHPATSPRLTAPRSEDREREREREGAVSPSASDSSLSGTTERDRMRKANSIVDKKKKPSEALTSAKSDSKDKSSKKEEKEQLAPSHKPSKEAKEREKDKSSERSRGDSTSSGLTASQGSSSALLSSVVSTPSASLLVVPPVNTSRPNGGGASPMRASGDGNESHSESRPKLSPRSLIDVIERGGDASDAMEEYLNKPLTQLDSRRCLRRQDISRQASSRVSIMSNRVFHLTEDGAPVPTETVAVPLGLTVTLFDEPQPVANNNNHLFHGEPKAKDSSVTTTASATVSNDNSTQTTTTTTTVNITVDSNSNSKLTTTTTSTTSTINSAVVSDRKAMKRTQSHNTKAPRSPMRKMLSTNDLQLTSSSSGGGGSPARSVAHSGGASRRDERDAASGGAGVERVLAMNGTDDPARVRRFQKLLAAEGGRGVNDTCETMSARIIGSDSSASKDGRERKVSHATPPQSPRHREDLASSTTNTNGQARTSKEADEALKLKRKTRISFTTDDLKVVKAMFSETNDGANNAGPGLTLQQKQQNRKSFLFASSSPSSLSEASTIENLPPVIDPSVQAVESSAAFVIEEGGRLGEVVSLELIDIPDYYADLFMGSKHFNWISVHQSKPKFPYFISVSAVPANGFFAGLITDRKGTKYSVTFIPISKKGVTMQSNADYVEKWLVKTFPQNNFLRFGKDIESMRAIASIEKNFRQELKEFQIALVPCKEGQTNPLDMFLTQEHSPSYEKFLKSMEYRDYIHGEYLIWHDKKVRYLSTTKLNSEQHRRLVGNTQVVIFFMEPGTSPCAASNVASSDAIASQSGPSSSFMLTDIDKMGIVPQFFFVIKPFGPNKYRIGFFNRINLQVSVEPLIPREPIDSITIKDFLLTKIYNAYMLGRSVPPINRLYESPKQQAINELVFKYASNAWIKKFCELERESVDLKIQS